MSKSVNPLLIGGFTVGALFLLLGALFIFGGSKLFHSDKVRYVIFFDSSLNGLEKGAPVKMQGVKIGEVVEIALQLDSKTDQIYKPVVIEIDRRTLTEPSGKPLPTRLSMSDRLINRDRLISAGFRARLEMQSLLTGLLYIDFDLHPNDKPLLTGADYKGLLEMPSIPTTTEEIRNVLLTVVKKIQDMPLETMVNDLSDSLREIKEILGSDDIKKSRAALANALSEIEETVRIINNNLGPILKNADRAIINTNAMVEEIRQDIKPVLLSTNAALVSARESMVTISDAVGPESSLDDTLQALKEASRSIIELTDYLERHPEALISGKEQ